jgi:cytochrome P450
LAVTIFFARPSELPPVPAKVNFSTYFLDRKNEGHVDEARVLETTLTPNLLTELSKDSEEIAFYSDKNKLAFIVSKPSDVTELLVEKSSYFLKGEEEAALSAAIGWGLITDEGEAHRKTRAQTRHSFTPKAIEGYLSTTRSTASSWIEGTGPFQEAGLVRGARMFTQLASEKTLFSLDYETTNFDYEKSIESLNRFTFNQMAKSTSEDGFSPVVKDFVHHKGLVQSHISQLIAKWADSEKTDISLLNHIIGNDESDPKKSPELQRQMSLFLQAATETTGSLISWCLILLAKHPKYWEHLHEEAHNEINSTDILTGRAKGWHSAVISETLRLFPSAWLIPRIALDDVQIGETFIPKGSRVVASPWVTHRLASVFDSPMEFLPERWLSSEPPIKGSYYPFGLGNRGCIGDSFGKMTATTMLFELASKGKIAKVSSTELEIGFSNLIVYPSLEITVEFG